MSNKLSKVAMSATVREYAQGAARDATASVAEFLAPTVGVVSTLFRYWTYNDTNQFKIPNTKRAVHGNATQIQLTGEEVNGSLIPNALDYPIDEYESLAEEDLMISFQEGADFIAQMGSLAHEKEVVDMALAAAGAGTDLAGTTSGMDFIDEIDQRIISVSKAAKTGSLMNIRLLWGPTAYRIVKNHSSTKNRFSAGGKKEIVNPSLADLSNALIGTPESRLSMSVYDAAGEGVAASNTFLLDSSVLIFASMAAPTRADCSFMKTFRLRNKFMVPGSYSRQDGRGEVAKFDWYCLPKVTNTAVIARLNISAS